MKQLELFEDEEVETYKIKNDIRLIELFAGVGSQAMALRDLGANFEHYKVVEFDKYAIASYNAIHGTNFPTLDITKIHAKDLQIVDTYLHTYILFSLPGLERGRKMRRNGKRQRDAFRASMGS